MSYVGIIEIEEVGKQRANELLAAGYELLGVDSVAWEAKRRTHAPGLSDSYIRRDFRYIIGRRSEQAPFPERRYPAQKPEAEDVPEAAMQTVEVPA